MIVCLHDLTLERTTNVEEVFPDRFDDYREDKKAPTAVPAGALVPISPSPKSSGSMPGRGLVRSSPERGCRRGRKRSISFAARPGCTRRRRVPKSTAAAASTRKRCSQLRRRRTGSKFADPKTPVIIQSFDDTTLKQLARSLPKVPRAFLVDPLSAARLDSVEKLREIATWATVVAPNKAIIEKRPEVVTWAHGCGADGHPLDVPLLQHRHLPIRPRRDGEVPVPVTAWTRCSRIIRINFQESDYGTSRQFPVVLLATGNWRLKLETG